MTSRTFGYLPAMTDSRLDSPRVTPPHRVIEAGQAFALATADRDVALDQFRAALRDARQDHTVSELARMTAVSPFLIYELLDDDEPL